MDIICLCHLRWDFVFQRPQHLLSRFAQNGRVFFIEEPVYGAIATTISAVSRINERVTVLTCQIADNVPAEEQLAVQLGLINAYFEAEQLNDFILWYYTPMAMPLAAALPEPALVVYDCMDELSAFRFAPVDIRDRELSLLAAADIVFTGGHSLYEAKKTLHNNIHFFPSSIDKAHFGKARTATPPAEYATIGNPKIGFFGVVDERFDIGLLQEMAAAKPEWHFMIIGPVVKIDESILPRAENIHYLGSQPYNLLPTHLAGWDVALIPFAINESTAFISPTKTPEYLAGGVPVVSTPIKDVIRPYGNEGLAYIAADAEGFVKGIEWSLKIRDDPDWINKVDLFLENMSWDNTWHEMQNLITATLNTLTNIPKIQSETNV